MTKMKCLFQKRRWQPARSKKSSDRTSSQQLLISFISGRSLMQNDIGSKRISPSPVKYKLSRFRLCCSPTRTGGPPGPSGEQGRQPSAVLYSCRLFIAQQRHSVESTPGSSPGAGAQSSVIQDTGSLRGSWGGQAEAIRTGGRLPSWEGAQPPRTAPRAQQEAASATENGIGLLL